MVSIIIRTLLIYVLLSFSLKIMGKRQLGELDIGELVTTLLISEVAAIPIDDPDIPLLNAILPILILFSVEIIISSVKNKSDKMKKFVEGEPAYIIYKGKLLQSSLQENRLSVNEFLSQLRQLGIGDITEVNYAVLEQGGKLSVFKSDESIAHTLVIDSVIQESNLKSLGYDKIWLSRAMKKEKADLEDVFLMTIDDNGKVYVLKRDRKRNNEQ